MYGHIYPMIEIAIFVKYCAFVIYLYQFKNLCTRCNKVQVLKNNHYNLQKLLQEFMLVFIATNYYSLL